ncbi:NLP/P60 family protein [Salipiger mucosus DSM 16094]|uniref:NLP/P60 family protein n=1 Tax=Salipiger mucosus DSM 16094 TaxID=1123237 RepID=S9QIA2_9RHOB|nr:NLP/P60 family protein [Salipiger mucosus DSM 16094]
MAGAELRGTVTAERFVEGEAACVAAPVVDLLEAPGGGRDRQLLLGAAVRVLERQDGWAFVQARADGYMGYLPEAALAPDAGAPTHRVAVRLTHAYAAPDMKTRDLCALSYGSLLAVTGGRNGFAEVRLPGAEAPGHVPARHLAPLDPPAEDPVTEAERLLGTPYLWGGNSALGIDCSGLVQVALHACGQACPGDSDLQEVALGEALPEGAAPRRGDLLFWKGHVAWVAGPDLLLHANAHHMAVALEPLEAAVARIDAQGDGRPTSHRRLR